MKGEKLTIEEMSTFCKKKGFTYPNSEIYGGLSGFYDFGHLGVELKNNIKQHWWKTFVQQREDIVGIDGSIISNPKVWQASGHAKGFDDFIVECKKKKQKFRADQLIEDVLELDTNGMKLEDIKRVLSEYKEKFEKKGYDLGEPKRFNLMFTTNIGPQHAENSEAFLRPETAQQMFTNFRLVSENARLKLPFGIAQIGKAFRNEISPRDFLFRVREFELMEIEYFVHPEKYDECPFIDEVYNHEVNILSEEMQTKKESMQKIKIKDALDKKIINTKWHAYWMVEMHKWYINLGANPDHFRLRQHVKDELSHYAIDTWDLEYEFPFGWKELQGFANRTDFDLKLHMEHSKSDLTLYDEESRKKIVPHVICEPAQGTERAFLVFMFDSYVNDKERGNIVLKLDPKLAPVKIGIFPLMSNKKEIVDKAKEVHKMLKCCHAAQFDAGGSIGRRYARADEIGIPICITVDFESLKDESVTIRDRDSTKQERVKISELGETVKKYLKK